MKYPFNSTLASDGTAVVSVRGEIDFANADDLSQGIRKTLAEWSPAVVRIDLRGATFIDSTGLGALIQGYRAAAESECRFVVVNPTESFRRVLSVTGLLDLFGVPDTENACGIREVGSDVAI
jgi:anti-sigma B factor antagonist